MPNEEKVEVEELPELPEVRDGEEDNTDYKTLASQFAASAKRYKKLYEKKSIEQKVEKSVEKELEKTNSGYEKLVQKSFLNSLGVPKEDHEYLLGEAKDTGKELDDLVEFKYVQEELAKRKEARATKEATPQGTKRSSNSSSDSADFWFQKLKRGDVTLGQIPGVKLQREVRKMKEAEAGGTGLVYGSIRR